MKGLSKTEYRKGVVLTYICDIYNCVFVGLYLSLDYYSLIARFSTTFVDFNKRNDTRENFQKLVRTFHVVR